MDCIVGAEKQCYNVKEGRADVLPVLLLQGARCAACQL